MHAAQDTYEEAPTEALPTRDTRPKRHQTTRHATGAHRCAGPPPPKLKLEILHRVTPNLSRPGTKNCNDYSEQAMQQNTNEWKLVTHKKRIRRFDVPIHEVEAPTSGEDFKNQETETLHSAIPQG